jgi:indolepyruvate ferredoxin oxidoreductase
MKHREIALEDRYVQEEATVMLSGVQALVRLPLDQKRADRRAGLATAGYISGYRGSPLGGYDQQLERARALLKSHDVVLQPGLNEDLGATAVWGSQQLGLFPGARYEGVFGLWYGKAPGVDRTGDVFKHANFAGTSPLGGVLAVAGDDHACKSSTLPSQSEFAFMDAEIPVLNPASIQDVLDYGLHGWAMSRVSGLWTGLIALADTMDSSAVIRVDPGRLAFRTPAIALPEGGLSIRRGDEPMAKEARLRQFKLPAAQAYVRANGLDRVLIESPRPRLGVVATGQAMRDVFEALDAIGLAPDEAAALGLAFYKVAMPWPLEPEGLRAFAAGVETLLVVEHKRALMEPQIKAALFDLPDGRRPRVIGKADDQGKPLLPVTGSIPIPLLAETLFGLLPAGPHAERAQAYLERVGAAQERSSAVQASAQRKPHYCSGCPHNTSTVVPEGSRALAGIGCHYMATFMPDRATDMTSQMGGEGVGWLGQAPFTDEHHVFVNLGDGTYSHSGSLAIRAAVAGGATLTYKLLYNDAVAMTGGQATESGQSVPQIARQLLGEGVAKVVIVADDPDRYLGVRLDPEVKVHPRAELDAVQRALRETRGVTVLIYDQVCATEKRRRIKRGLMQASATRAFINTAVCEGCGDCSRQSNCLSIHPVETEFGTKRQIDQSSCNQDLRCVDGFCPSFVTITGGQNARRAKPRPDFDATLLPLPEPMDLSRARNLILTGVGGTGVTTAAAILGMAAHIDGKAASTLDMTGLAQKGGAVISHVRIADHPEDIRSGRVPPAGADVLIAGDLIVAANLDTLSLLCSQTTHAVANTDVTPTSAFVFDRNARFDNRDLLRKLNAAVLDIGLVNAETLAETYLYDALYSNMITLGFAWQRGLVPVSLRGLYRAIKLNGAAIAENMLAFDLGRLAAHDPGRLRALAPSRAAPAALSLDALIAHRRAHLTAWQDSAWAQRWESVVMRVRAAEHDLGLGDALTRAVAVNLAKLMSYKDEYEVARLYTDGAFVNALREAFTGDLRVKIWLAPPVLSRPDPATGRPAKRAFGAWVLGVFAVLKRFKGLRGGPFDPFGHTAERRMERALISAYEATVDTLLAGLSAATHRQALEIANLPDQIRGFGPVKDEAVAQMRAREAALLARYGAG